MITYKVTIKTGEDLFAGTDNYVYCKLIGESGESKKTSVEHWFIPQLGPGDVNQYDIDSDEDIGNILFVELEISRFMVHDYWFCCSVTVESPWGGSYHFPCYMWLADCTIKLREGTAKKFCDDQLPILKYYREHELQERQRLYRWKNWAPNLPRCIDAESVEDLPMDLRFNFRKQFDFNTSLGSAFAKLGVKQFLQKFEQSWTSTDDFEKIFCNVDSSIAAFVKDNWKQDWIFGYQFLNGFNPVLIQKCEKIPVNFPVTNAMVMKSLVNSTLEQEIENGRIFIVSYEMLDGLPANVIDGVQQYLAAPICLLHLNEQHQLMPIAIQLKQTPGGDNPIFLPSDAELDWLLAKMWVRSSDFQHLELVSHLLRTHLIGETFGMATLRNLPAVHPIYKLLIPHVKYTMEINTMARQRLISPDGFISQMCGVKIDIQHLTLAKAFQALTYRSLCLPEKLDDHGVTDLKGYYYKDDAKLIWSAIHKFVSSIVLSNYDSDKTVLNDPELQDWIKDLTGTGLQDLKNSEFPTSFRTRKELEIFLTMIIFTCSAQHSAVNNGQYDWAAWVPNSPCSMRRPPPTRKGFVTMEDIMDSLPGVNQSCLQMAITWVLTRPQPDKQCLGEYNEYFTEESAKDHIKRFQEDLQKIDCTIRERNKGLPLPYTYLLHQNIENSVSI
ncbi:polyunsaturated fatty acid 5-lipoxygenase-like [Scyliorhinus canicula]|uniref:polyunsaturated fatty acid 5-lipoxygenase-like n=1 Tax=Scyliorhinus canicula TaxID=7830 RepID=UPI0018F2FC34|nr:polyunsaturated fatty acid 5-lipoxygenase-like [Scyliorhinus canicula]